MPTKPFLSSYGPKRTDFVHFLCLFDSKNSNLRTLNQTSAQLAKIMGTLIVDYGTMTQMITRDVAEYPLHKLLAKEGCRFHLVLFEQFKQSLLGMSLKSRHFHNSIVLFHANVILHSG